MKKARKEAWEEFVGSINERTSSQEMRDKIRQLSGKRKTQQIKKLKGSNGRTITNPKEMAYLLAMQFADTSSDEHYSQTFKEKKKKAEETGINIDIFNEENYSGPLTEEELDTALTSPGPDDLHYDNELKSYRPFSLWRSLQYPSLAFRVVWGDQPHRAGSQAGISQKFSMTSLLLYGVPGLIV
jgi:hypothetical protein